MPTTIISDNFNRANSNTVGAAQTGGTWTQTVQAAGDVQILSNQLKVGRISAAAFPATPQLFLLHGLTTPRNYSVSMILPVGSAAARFIYIIVGTFGGGTIASYEGFSFKAGEDTVNNTSLIANSFGSSISGQVNFTVQQWVWLDVTPNGASNIDMNLYYSTTSTKPGSPTLTLTNVVKGTGTGAGFLFDGSGAGQYALVEDYLFVDTTAGAATGNFFLAM